MYRFIKKRSKKTDHSSGALVYIGDTKAGKVRITIIDYDEMKFEEREIKTVEECFHFKETPTVTWININGIHQPEIIDKIGKNFGLHPLILEDMVNTTQHPKMEDFGDYIFIILKMLYYDEKINEIRAEHVSLILGPNYVISFKESDGGDVFDPVRERIRNGKSRIRKLGTDYLVYSLIDAIVDSYFIILEKLGEKIEFLEEELVADPRIETLHAIHDLKTEFLFLRKSVWPLREVIGGLERGDSPLIHESTGIYIRDVYDHTVQVIDAIETFRDMLSEMLDIYLSSVSNKLNEIMKVLTIIATIFIPLTFIV